MNIAPFTMAKAALPAIRRLIDDGFDFDLIDAHYYYPDGVAAAIIAEKLGKPFVLTARGSDLNLIADFDKPRRLILETAAKAKASIGVSKSLTDRLAELGADTGKLRVLRNGVDLERFQMLSRDVARADLNLPLNQRVLVSVGRLVEAKGHHIAIEALTKLPDTQLVLIGTGPERQSLMQLADSLGVGDRVRLAGQIPNEQLKWWYSAADALILCSSREGWANVLLESMACGTPVVATKIPGTSEVVTSSDAGLLFDERTSGALLSAINQLFSNPPERMKTRQYAENFSWDATTQGQMSLFKRILGKGALS